MRTFGVEEELLVVDENSYAPIAVAAQMLEQWAVEDASETQLVAEIQQEMIETVTPPATTSADLRAHLVTGRRLAEEAARQNGAHVAALATSPFTVDLHSTAKSRYQRMMQRYGITARRNLACGCHVHVSIDSPEEGVGVLDRIRVWLPAVLALSANSPFAGGEDTGYASYRFATWRQWPSAGPLPVLQTVGRYQAHERDLLSSGVLMDEGMLYFDARLSRSHPTVEVRVADVLPTPDEAVAVAALVRALAEAAAAEWRDGVPAPTVSADELRLDSWQASLHGLSGCLVHPSLRRLVPAAEVIAALEDRVRPALRSAGDEELVTDALATMLAEGTGAERQRATLHREGSLAAVVAEAAARTVAAGAVTARYDSQAPSGGKVCGRGMSDEHVVTG